MKKKKWLFWVLLPLTALLWLVFRPKKQKEE